jgi:serine protease Do
VSRIAFLVLVSVTAAAVAQPKQTREQKVREDRKKVEAEGFWIYNDLPNAFAEAKKSGKPLLVVLRCIPCEECVKLDDDLVNQDPVIRPLLDKFVCVRVVSTNGLDLSLFQFDTDQSFAAFLLNADGTIYGRFGTRSHRTNWVGDVSLAGLAKALQGALDLHADYPKNKVALAGKRGPAPEFPSPEKYPTLKGKYGPALAESGNVVQSCIHCHQIGDAQREYNRSRREPIPETVLFPYPHPKVIGLTLDPKERAAVLKVEPRSPAAEAGFASGDAILSLAGQPLLSVADVQWVLHTVPADGGKVAAQVIRAGKMERLTVALPAGWRRTGDLSWRATSWGLRRMATGGLLLEELPPADRPKTGTPDGMALRVKHVGEYGPHAAAKKAGFRAGDVVVEFDGRTDMKRETDVLRHGVTARQPGDRVSVSVLREGKTVTLTLPMQE